ncbi:MAG: type II toxin-antitoxin system RelE/ParE family toxin [Dongiaceae bacterium]
MGCHQSACGQAGIARAIYATASRRRLVVLYAFVKKTEKTPRSPAESGGRSGVPKGSRTHVPAVRGLQLALSGTVANGRTPGFA